jgi:hypothetical protein
MGADYAAEQPSSKNRPKVGNMLLEGAGEQYERALVISEAALGPDHPNVTAIRGNLDGVLHALQQAPS